MFGLFSLWFTKKQKAGKLIVSLGVLLVIAFGYNSIPNLLILPLERSYPKYEKSDINVKHVAVLGGGSSSDNQIPLSNWLSSPSLGRLVEGIIIYKKNPGSLLILSGYSEKDKKSNAEVMADVAISLGVPKNDIILEKLPKDTYEEVLLIKEIVKDKPFILVTSAAHMKRAMMLFKKQKAKPIPAPTDYLFKDSNNEMLQLPSAAGFEKANSAVHEYLGILWAKLRGFI